MVYSFSTKYSFFSFNHLASLGFLLSSFTSLTSLHFSNLTSTNLTHSPFNVECMKTKLEIINYEDLSIIHNFSHLQIMYICPFYPHHFFFFASSCRLLVIKKILFLLIYIYIIKLKKLLKKKCSTVKH